MDYSNFPLKRLAYKHKHLDPIEYPLICEMFSLLNVRLFKLSTGDRNLVVTLVEMESFTSQANVAALIPSLCSMFV